MNEAGGVCGVDSTGTLPRNENQVKSIYLHKGVKIFTFRKTATTRADLHVGNRRKGVQGVTYFLCDIILFWGPQL